MSVRFEMRVDDALMTRIDSARGEESRAAWIKRALVVALGEPKGGHPSEAGERAGSTPAPSAPAPRRAPEAIPVRDFTAERLAREKAATR